MSSLNIQDNAQIKVCANGRKMTLAAAIKIASTIVQFECIGQPVHLLPELPAAKYVWLINLPLLAAVPELPAATDVWFENLPLLAAVPELPAAKYVRLINLPMLAACRNCPPRPTCG